MQIKNKRQIFTTVLTILISVFLVAGVVLAVTTISTNIVTEGNLQVDGNSTLGSDAADTTIIKSRMATGTVAGSEISLGASYTQKEGMEMRYGIDSWTGIAGDFKGYYFRTTANVGNASYGLQGMQIYGVSNITGTTGLKNLQPLYAEMLIKNTTAATTITDASAVEANVSIDSQTGTLTFTNDVYALKAKVQTGDAGGIADATKLNGIAVQGRGNVARTFGNAISIVDPEAAVATWTKGLNISPTNVITPIYVSTSAGTITGEVRGVDLAYTGTLSSGDSIVGGNFAVTTAGTAGAWASGIYAKVTQGGTKNVDGYISGAEFEVVNSADNVSSWFPLVLDATNNGANHGGPEAYIFLRDYGSLDMQNLLAFGPEWEAAIGTNSSTALLSTTSDHTATHTIRIVINNVPYWILLSNAQ